MILTAGPYHTRALTLEPFQPPPQCSGGPGRGGGPGPGGAPPDGTHHGPGVLPLGQLVEDPQEVDAGEQVPPAELVVVPRFLRTHTHTHT